MGREAPAAAVIEQIYRRALAERQAALAGRERTHAAYAGARLAVFAVAVGMLVFGGLSAANWLTVPFGAFVVLAVAHAGLLNARDRAKSAVGFYERGLARIEHRWAGTGRDGGHLAPESHLYAADLDVFGRGSLFELLATVRTHAGEETLARWLLAPAAPDEIRARQEAARELASRLDLRERIAVLGDELRIGVHANLLRRWSQSPVTLSGTPARIGLALLVAATLGTAIWWARTGDLGGLLLALAAAQLGAAAWFKPRVQAVVEAVDEPAHDLGLLADLLAILEREPFASPALRRLQAAVSADGRTASRDIRGLSQRVAMLSSRSNVMFAIPAGVMMWATQWAFAIEAWRGRAGAHIPAWLDAVGEFEALAALGGFHAEHPGYAFPEFVDGSACLDLSAAAHPLLGDDAVLNDVSLGGASPALLVVSGSNMSGKSTLLRTLGANVVLASMGAPVRARACRLSPLAVGAAIRVQDSLADGRSRFYAEITRLKAVVDLSASRGGAVLFLLDEILSGTNSHDRRIGAEAVLATLIRAGAIGLATTHDLALGEIVDRLPGRAANVHFEDQFEAGALAFDYRLRPGLVRTSNALALMRQIGLEI